MNDLQKAQRLNKRLKTLRKEKKPTTHQELYFLPAFSWGFRLGIDWTTRALGGVALGWGVDYFFHTQPIGIITGLTLGTIAGFVKVYKTFSKG